MRTKEEILYLLIQADKDGYLTMPPLWMSEIARRIGHAPSTVGRYLDELEEEGLVEDDGSKNWRGYRLKKGIGEKLVGDNGSLDVQAYRLKEIISRKKRDKLD